MPIKTDLHIIKGMQKDISVSKANAEFAFDAMNIRLTAREGNTLLSVTNEKGNKEVPINTLGEAVTIEGIVIGKEIINNYLILFTTSTDENPEYRDRIYRLEKDKNGFTCIILYKGNLNFDVEHPIESIGIFENKDIQKVYWVDGKNPVRFINITKTYNGGSDIFNFVQNLSLDESIIIKSNTETQGKFPSGTIQYVFTYYNKFGSETNIFYHSPLYYSHRYNRGGSPEELGSNSFDITISNLNKNFDYIRVYSIVRTSIDAVPTVRKVVDLSPKSDEYIYYTDTNTTGELVDPSLLLYLGGENIIPECITHKDNTLFLGNYKLKDELFSEEIKDNLSNKESELYRPVTFKHKNPVPYEVRAGQYSYNTQLNQNSYEITTLKSRETYRFGIQFQNQIGKWSEILWVGDYKVDLDPIAEVPTELVSINLMGNKLVKGNYVIPNELLINAIKLGYKKARGVIVYPSDSDKDIICQGVLNPTVYKTDDRDSNSPYAQSSWFFRPYVRDNMLLTGMLESSFGSIAAFVDKGPLGSFSVDLFDTFTISRNAEIGTFLSYIESDNKTKVDREFYVDANIVTMHSPDIEFQDSIAGYTDASLNCNVVGYINIDACKSFRDVQASTPSAASSDYGFYSIFPSNIPYTGLDETLKADGRMLISGVHWMGEAIKSSEDGWVSTGKQYGWLVSPWQRSGSLINDFAKRPNDQVVSKLKYNRMINTRVSYTTVFGTNWAPPKGISNITVFDSNENVLNYIGSTGHSYYGNVDKVLIPGSKTYGKGAKVGYTNRYDFSFEDDSSVEGLYKALIQTYNDSDNDDNYTYTKDPVSMKYKSSKHVVFEFNNTFTSDSKASRVLLPAIADYGTNNIMKLHTVDIDATYSTFNVEHPAILWLAELSRTVPETVKFGGKTKESLINNRWHIAGDSIFITEDGINPKENVEIEYLQGDTYFQRYDCLKTYPYTLEDENNVTEILSFYCETRVNIDGRYDRNRANFNNLALSPNNFNLLNPVYSQKNNYFNYFVLDTSLKINDFNNSLTWSKEKSLGENIDQWTNITLASTLELDGDKGEITALKTFNNEIFCFQKQGISNILFNSRVQIPTSDGVPIEITNGLKVQGKRYLSSIGCSNKWSIAESPIGLYFIDSNTDEIYLFNGQITSLSTQLGFSSYAKEHNHLNKWNPITFDNFRTHYDKSNGDVYFTDKNSCLVYSESLGQFTSFMSYEDTPYMFNIDNSFYALKNNKIWEQFTGDYNSFYGETKPYSITVISNPDSFYDKIFNTVEFRADTWDNDKLLNTTFDTLEVWNEYQQGKSNLSNILGKSSTLKRKFRVWRANIPRDISNNRDRIRNTWAYIKLEHSNPSNYKTEFHDLMVHYFI